MQQRGLIVVHHLSDEEEQEWQDQRLVLVNQIN